MFRPVTLSNSSIECYENCPLQYRYQYIDHMLGLPSDALLIGELTHLALKNFHLHKNPYAEVKRKILNPITDVNLGIFGMVRRMVDSYIKNPIKDKSIALEKKFRVPIMNSKREKIDIPLIGVIDRLTENGIIEYKTSMNLYTQAEVDNKLQGTIYAYAYFWLKKKLGIVKFCVLNKKEKDPKKIVQIFETARTKEHFDKLYDKIQEILKKMKENDFEATPGQQCYYCQFRDFCSKRYRKTYN